MENSALSLAERFSSHERIPTSAARQNVSLLVERTFSGNSTVWTRYSRDKVAIVPVEHLMVIDYLMATGQHASTLESARQERDRNLEDLKHKL